MLLFCLDVLGQNPPWFQCNNVSVTNCNSAVPSLFVDMRGYPNGKWYSCSIGRGSMIDTCCGFPQTNNNDYCIEFKVLLDPNAEGFIFQIPANNEPEWQDDKQNTSGAPGSSGAGSAENFEYRINCGSAEYDALDPVCLDDIGGGFNPATDTLYITLCKPGGNDNVYRIKSLKAEIDPIDSITAEGCEVTLTVPMEGIDPSTITWSHTPTNPSNLAGIYNSWLSSTSGTATVTVTVPPNATLPANNTLTYEVCGSPVPNPPNGCTGLQEVCALASVTVLPIGSINVDLDPYCGNDPASYEPEADVMPTGTYTYYWYDDTTETTLLASGSQLDEPGPIYSSDGWKSVVVENPNYIPCSRRKEVFEIELLDTPVAVINGPFIFCPNEPLTFTADNAGAGASYAWTFGAGASPATSSSRTPPNVTYSTCGDKTITLTVTLPNGCMGIATRVLLSDITDPVLTVPPDITVDCDVGIDTTNTGSATATDQCDYMITFTDNTIPGNCPNNFQIERTWTVTDACGNFDSGVQIITVQDTTRPTIICNIANLILECDQNYNNEITQWLSNTVNDLQLGASDNCGTISVTHDYNSDIPNLDCTAQTGEEVTFTITDECGNFTTCSAFIIIDDTEPPTITCSIDPLILECDEDYLGEIFIWLDQTMTDLQTDAQDDCGLTLTVTHDWDSISLPTLDCNGVLGLSIEFTITDNCENFTTCQGLITIDDTQPPIITCNLDDLLLQCDADPSNYTPLINQWISDMQDSLLANATDDCNGPLTVSDDWIGTLPTLDCNGSTGVLVTFTIEDACGNDTTCTAEIIIIDDQPPIINCSVTDLVLECGEDYTASIQSWINAMETNIDNNSSDDCGATLTIDNDWNNDIPVPDCNLEDSIIVYFWAEDQCGNRDSCSASIFIDDTQAPILDCPPDTTLTPCLTPAEIMQAYNDWTGSFTYTDCSVTTTVGLSGNTTCGYSNLSG